MKKSKSTLSKKQDSGDSMERLKNLYEQAKLDGNTNLMKFYKAMIDARDKGKTQGSLSQRGRK